MEQVIQIDGKVVAGHKLVTICELETNRNFFLFPGLRVFHYSRLDAVDKLVIGHAVVVVFVLVIPLQFPKTFIALAVIIGKAQVVGQVNNLAVRGFVISAGLATVCSHWLTSSGSVM